MESVRGKAWSGISEGNGMERISVERGMERYGEAWSEISEGRGMERNQ